MKNLISGFNIRHLFWFLPLLSMAIHWRIFSTDLIGVHLWRQSQTQLNIQNFYRYDFNILNPRVNITNLGPNTIYRYEFPIMQWSVACLYKLLGESIVITRIYMFFLGLCTIGGVFFLGRILFKDDIIAGLMAWAFNFSPLFYYYTMNPMPDNLALCGSVWGIAWFFEFLKSERYRHAVYSAVFLCLSVLAKLPFVVFYAPVGIYLLQKVVQTSLPRSGKQILAGSIYLASLLPAMMWYAWVIPGWSGNKVLSGALEQPLSALEAFDIAQFNVFEFLPKMLLNFGAVPFFIAGIYFLFKNKAYRKEEFRLLAVSGLGVLLYFGFEMNVIRKNHDYYMMPFLWPVFVLVGYGIKNWWYGSKAKKSLTVVLLLLLPLIAFFTVDKNWSVKRSFFCNPALIENREELRNAVPRDEMCIMQNDISMHIYPYALDKIGPVFSKDELPSEWVDDMIRRLHIRYMYSDARKVDENPAVVPYLDTLLLERGTMRVYRLKTAEQLNK
jgi:Dolichyl-phosphate-mannose-protein mannosyltransferase